MKSNLIALPDNLEQMSTKQLDGILADELQKDCVDEQYVRQVLSVLEQREGDKPVESNAGIERAWEQYRKSIENRVGKSKSRRGGGLLRAASILVIAGLLFFVLPQAAEANNFIEMLAKWSDSAYQLFGENTTNHQHVEYVFKTDNPGLQEVYNAVVELGVTDPVVPMWLPEGYELVECKNVKSPTQTGVRSTFSDGEHMVILKIDLCANNMSREYEKDDTQIAEIEIGGLPFTIMRNNDMWVVIWTRGRVECFLTIDCPENVLYMILESIYVTEVK